MQALGQAGLTWLLGEGGARLAGSLVRAGLVDRLAWFHAPGVMGGDGLAAALGFSPALLYYLLLGLTSVTAVTAFDAVGGVLLVAFVIVPRRRRTS